MNASDDRLNPNARNPCSEAHFYSKKGLSLMQSPTQPCCCSLNQTVSLSKFVFHLKESGIKYTGDLPHQAGWTVWKSLSAVKTRVCVRERETERGDFRLAN